MKFQIDTKLKCRNEAVDTLGVNLKVLKKL